MNIKNIILGVSAIGSYLAYSLFVSYTIDACDLYCGKNLGEYHNVVLFFPFILVFSLVTYKLPGEVFRAWWKFTRVVAPIIFLLSFLINLNLHHNPAGEFQNIFDAPALVFLYSIFTIGSIIAIVRGYHT